MSSNAIYGTDMARFMYRHTMSRMIARKTHKRCQWRFDAPQKMKDGVHVKKRRWCFGEFVRLLNCNRISFNDCIRTINSREWKKLKPIKH